MPPYAGSQRLPAAVIASVGLHVGALWLFLYSRNLAKRNEPQIISNVDLLIQTPQAQTPARAAVPAAPPSTWNFLKLALPTLPKALPQALSVPLPEEPKPLMPEEPKLQDRAHRAAEQDMQALNLDRTRQAQAQNINEDLNFQRHEETLAQLPRLEDVGERQVANLPQALKLDSERRQAQAMEALGADENLPPPGAQAAPAAAPLIDASPSAQRPSAFAALLPQGGLPMEAQARPAEAPDLSAGALPTTPRKAEILSVNKKGVSIEGPLANRKVLHYEIPTFPDWARQEGILEASVSIRFWVSPDGTVQPDMNIERTSGYGRLDRLAMASLSNWKFAPINSDERQWGVITFRFVLE